MPTFQRGDARIHYSVHGPEGAPPVLLIAPGGLRSAEAAWGRVPWNPLEQLEGFRRIAMDQRNAGASTAPVAAGDGWHSYTADQLGLMDHLGIRRFAVLGMCIGGPYIMGLCRAAPERVLAAVALQPIGVERNRRAFQDMLRGWIQDVGPAHPEADRAVWEAFGQAMFGGEFMFNATREQAAACRTPLLVFMGDDLYHPASISRELAALAPNAELVERWKQPEHHAATTARVRAFLQQHAG